MSNDAMHNPFVSFEAVQKMMSEAFGRAQAYAEEYGAIERQLVERAQTAVATWAQMTQDAIAYCAQLSAQARKLGLDAASQAATTANKAASTASAAASKTASAGA